ncbi:hypothetical protein FOCC_FOCC016442 [Frankliniella occidentalis]|nr:hypothetical protein FOCC_FOCC016442 [Frankliniella occidentalis]
MVDSVALFPTHQFSPISPQETEYDLNFTRGLQLSKGTHLQYTTKLINDCIAALAWSNNALKSFRAVLLQSAFIFRAHQC